MSSMTNPESGPPAAPETTPKRGLFRQLVPYLTLVAIGAGILLFMNYLNQQKAKQAAAAVQTTYKIATATRGDLNLKVRLNGVTTARDYADIVAPRLRGRGMERGMNILKLAPAGSIIQAGELVAELDAQTLKDRIDDERDNLDQRENNVKKLKVQQELDMENLRQTLRVAKSELDKAELDFRISEVRTPVDQELLKLAVEEAKARYEQLSKDVAQKEISQRADMRITEIELQISKSDLERYTRDLSRFSIRAPMTGMVVMQTINRPGGDQQQIQEGDTVNPGQPFMKIVDVSSMQVEGTINQAESSHFRIGQFATVGLDAFPGAAFRGQVHSIGALATQSGRQQYYIRNVPIRVQMLQFDQRVIPDLTASADVALEAQENVLMVPASAVTVEKGASYVSVQGPKGFERREVKTGLNNGTHVAILDGLQEGDKVRFN
ncbi:MAG TPA: efflux RND transporter periplasmic adaptor subunit [Bryobacteraceae bacterium]|nr:efflux RND transporter periplasmic adaptor subunit [Bryobacteraceae bacterium]